MEVLLINQRDYSVLTGHLFLGLNRDCLPSLVDILGVEFEYNFLHRFQIHLESSYTIEDFVDDVV